MGEGKIKKSAFNFFRPLCWVVILARVTGRDWWEVCFYGYRLGKMLSASCGVNLAEGLMQGDMEIMFAFLVPECGWLSRNSPWQFLTTRQQILPVTSLVWDRCWPVRSPSLLLSSYFKRQMPELARFQLEHFCHSPALSPNSDLYYMK